MRFLKTMTALSFLLVGGISCNNDDSNVEPFQPNTGEQAEPIKSVVDLGLSVKWATCNLGADSPEQIGDYYAWGETATKNEYTETTYFDTNYSTFQLSGEKNICGTNRDAAYVRLGKDWRMPTTEEIHELVNSCTWTEETLNGVLGIRGTASNGNSIFFPITGMFAGDRIQSTSQGCYWSGELYADGAYSSKHAAILIFFKFKSNEIHSSYYYRFEGMAIRPVFVGTEIGNNDTPSDDNSVTPPSDEIEDNLPTEAKLFVGYWVNSGSSREYCPDLYLSADGICYATHESMDNKWDWDYTWYKHVYRGYWAYDSSTKIFATTLSWQFNVTLSNEWAWAGIYKKGSKTYNQSLHKASNLSVAQFLINEIGGWSLLSSNNTSIKTYTIFEDENENDYTFNYQRGGEKGTLTIKNPFYLSKVSLTFTGSINETLYRDRE